MKRWSALAAFVMALSLLVLVLPAQATAPRQTTRESDFSFPIRCGGFALLATVHFTNHIQRFFGEDGVRRVTVHNTWDGVITNKATGEFIAADPGRWKDTLIGKEGTTTGRVFSIKIKALDIFIHGTGRTMFNLRTGETTFQSGPDSHHENYDDLCEALA